MFLHKNKNEDKEGPFDTSPSQAARMNSKCPSRMSKHKQKGVMSAAACVTLSFARQKALRIFIGFRSRVVRNAIAAHLIDKTGMKNACLDMTA